MKNLYARIWIMKIILLIIIFTFSLHAKDVIQPLTEPWMPYQMETEQGLEGISVDLVKEIQKRIGNEQKIKVYPWSRGYNLTLKKTGYALFLTTKSKKREKLFKWVGPISSMKLLFFKNANRKDLDIRSLEDAKKVKSIAVAVDNIAHQKLVELGFKNLYVNKLANYSLKKVLESKTDLYPTEYYSFLYELKKKNLQNKIVPVKMQEPIMESQLYIAFNKETPQSVIKKWQDALDKIKKDGTYEKILKKYR